MTILAILLASILLTTGSFLAQAIVRGADGYIDIQGTLRDHIANMSNPMYPPGYEYEEPVIVDTQLRMNKLVSFDEETTLTKFDFFFRLYWEDKRFDVPDTFAALPEWLQNDGIELRDMCVSPAEEPGGCDFWVPHMLTFVGNDEISVHASTIRLKPGGQMYWWATHFFLCPLFYLSSHNCPAPSKVTPHVRLRNATRD